MREKKPVVLPPPPRVYPVWAEGGPYFSSRRRMVDVSDIQKGRSENLKSGGGS
jgi:hypothetical protein